MAMRSYEMDIDWELLAEQKDYLLQLIHADCKSPRGLTTYGSYSLGDHPLDGLLHLLDEIEFQAEKMGEPVYEDEETANANADAE